MDSDRSQETGPPIRQRLRSR